MPIPSNPPYLLDVIGSQADVFSIPETTPEGSGALSYASGWPQIVASALSAGGLPPQREYFNAVNKLLSQHIFFLQSGGVYPWNSALDYNPGARVMGSNGIVYVAVAASGPDVSEVGAQNPTTDSANTYWQTLAASLMSSSGGLVVDPETGQASVDFSQMPTDKFEALLQSIRVPIWLTSNKIFYVDGNTGNDSLVEGRGESRALPFKTLQAAINFITDNYNLSRYNIYIYCHAVTISSTLTLPDFTATTGRIYIQKDPQTAASDTYGATGKVTSSTTPSGIEVLNGAWTVKNVQLTVSTEENTGDTTYAHAVVFDVLGLAADVDVGNCDFSLASLSQSKFAGLHVMRCDQGQISLLAGVELSASVGEGEGYPRVNGMTTSPGGTIRLDFSSSDTPLKLSGTFGTLVYSTGLIVRNGVLLGNVDTTGVESATYKYRAMLGGRINTNGGGTDYFGTVGKEYVQSATYSWYQ